MTNRMNVHSIWLLVVLAGCAVDPADLHGRTTGGVTLPVAPEGTLTLETVDMAGQPLQTLAPAMSGGRLVVRAVGERMLYLDALAIELGDVQVIKRKGELTFVHQLTNLRLRLEKPAPIDAVWSEGGRKASGVITTDLLLDLALRDDRGVGLPLATQRLRAVELAVTVEVRADGVMIATIDGSLAGSLWDFGDVEFRDLSLSVTAMEDR
jgi:hypothetical protein